MHTRFLTSVVAALAGGVLVASSLAFAAGTTAWLGFGIGLGLMVLSVVPALFGERRPFGLLLDGAAGALAIWTVIAGVVFSGDVVKWLSFGEGAAFVALAFGGLALNQVRLARGSHIHTPVAASSASLETAEPIRPSAVAA
jgi:hypothetical protein